MTNFDICYKVDKVSKHNSTHLNPKKAICEAKRQGLRVAFVTHKHRHNHNPMGTLLK